MFVDVFPLYVIAYVNNIILWIPNSNDLWLRYLLQNKKRKLPSESERIPCQHRNSQIMVENLNHFELEFAFIKI